MREVCERRYVGGVVMCWRKPQDLYINILNSGSPMSVKVLVHTHTHPHLFTQPYLLLLLTHTLIIALLTHTLTSSLCHRQRQLRSPLKMRKRRHPRRHLKRRRMKPLSKRRRKINQKLRRWDTDQSHFSIIRQDLYVSLHLLFSPPPLLYE